MRRKSPYFKGPVSITIAATVRGPDIAALATAAGWMGFEPIICTINSGVDVATLSISGIPHDCLTIINRGRIGGVINSGTALYTRTRIAIDNSSGTIFGGGGKGGHGETITVGHTANPTIYRATGYGGIGGDGAGFNTSGTLALLSAQPGQGGSTDSVNPGTGAAYAYGGSGGQGGGIGAAGFPGAYGAGGGLYTVVSTSERTDGSPAGAYVDGASYVTWIAAGTRQGNAIN
ncbi:hypothetical protein GCM10027082_24710 [Comamonas humi]